jgi:hypothetical protein
MLFSKRDCLGTSLYFVFPIGRFQDNPSLRVSQITKTLKRWIKQFKDSDTIECQGNQGVGNYFVK